MRSVASFFLFPFVALVLLVNGSEGLPECASGWKRNKNTCYKAFSTRTTWQLARDRCEALNASLPIIPSSEENSFLSNDILTATSWIGASRCRNNQFCWPDGSTVPVTAAWNRGEPSNPISSEGCVVMIFQTNSTGKWSDILCKLRRPFICTRALPGVTQISEVVHVSHSSVIVMWNKPAPSSSQVSQYFVMYKDKEDEHFTTLTVPAIKAITNITGLKAATEYVVKVKTGSIAGNSTVGPVRSFKTIRLSRSPLIVDLSVFRVLKETDSIKGCPSQVVILCTATGTSPLTFNWIHDKNIIQTVNDSSRYSDKLVLSGNREQYMGKVTCRVTDLEGTDSRNIDIPISKAEAFSVVQIKEFQIVLAVLLFLVVILLVIACLFFCLRKRGCSKLPHIKAESFRIKERRQKDYIDPPPTVEMGEIEGNRECEVKGDNKEVEERSGAEHYTSLQRNEDGTFIGGNEEAQEMTYANMDPEAGYPPSGGAFNEEGSYPYNDKALVEESGYPDSHHAFGYDDSYPASGHALNEGDGYLPGDNAGRGSHQFFDQGRVDAGSYERLGEIDDFHRSNQLEGPMYGNCLDEQGGQILQNQESPIYSNC